MKIVKLKRTRQLEALYSVIRNKKTPREDFIFYSDRIIRLLVEEALNLLPVKPLKLTTPTGSIAHGKKFLGKICAVSILRSGEAMETALREVCKKIRIGKILIQRDEKTALPNLIYSKLPPNLSERYILLLDPMLATGGSACKAIKVLKENGAREEKIIFVNLISCPEGIRKIKKEFPEIQMITGVIDKKLNKKAYILPGLGDFGDRYFGT